VLSGSVVQKAGRLIIIYHIVFMHAIIAIIAGLLVVV
jgi:hypothetical protein